MRRPTPTILILAPILALTGCPSSGGSSGGFGASTTAPSTSATTPGSATPGSTTPGSTAPGSTAGASVVALQLGAGVPAHVQTRIQGLVQQASKRPVQLLAASATVPTLPSGSLVLTFGDTPATRALIPATAVANLASEGFILRSAVDASGVTTVATDGQADLADPFGLAANRGLLYGSYALLEEVGFAFLHPLAPTVPGDVALAAPVDRTESPRWRIRGLHVHTEHPLELTELLQGWGKGDPNDAASFQSMLPEWDVFLEWAIANRLNRVEWFLLSAQSWQAFASSQERQSRLSQLTAAAHVWGIAAGADDPIAEKQQHAWFMVDGGTGTLAQQQAQIQARVDWLVKAGFDFFATELGTSEFTSTDDTTMVAWLNTFAAAVQAAGKKSYCKAHCSTGQVAAHYPDPLNNGGPLNYNFLARVCDPSLGVFPHTVEVYGLDDPAPTYGNTDFGYMRQFMEEEVGRREVVWHPETAYWVGYDVNVPLYLPVYAERRVHDLRLIAADEAAGKCGRGALAGGRIDGQMTFSSGWEWGYWLNDVVTARASWDPHASEPTDEAALRKILEPVLRTFGVAAGPLADSIVATCASENALLVQGKVAGQAPSSIVKRNGMGYLEGWDTWGDVSVLAQNIPFLHFTPTQPTKLGLVDMRSVLAGGPDYPTQVAPLLAEMHATFETQAGQLDALRLTVPAAAQPLMDDLADAARMLALRARQIHGLYDYVQGDVTQDPNARARLQDARDALDRASVVVSGREPRYRCDPDRIAGWRPNPTAYSFTYLWSVHSLQFWWRDEEKAVDHPWSPVVWNTISPVDVGIGEGLWDSVADAARAWGDPIGLGWLVDGLAAPTVEPVYPDNGLRSRP